MYRLEIDPDLHLTTEEECKHFDRMARFGRWETGDWWTPHKSQIFPEDRISREGYIILRRKVKQQ